MKQHAPSAAVFDCGLCQLRQVGRLTLTFIVRGLEKRGGRAHPLVSASIHHNEAAQQVGRAMGQGFAHELGDAGADIHAEGIGPRSISPIGTLSLSTTAIAIVSGSASNRL